MVDRLIAVTVIAFSMVDMFVVGLPLLLSSLRFTMASRKAYMYLTCPPCPKTAAATTTTEPVVAQHGTEWSIQLVQEQFRNRVLRRQQGGEHIA